VVASGFTTRVSSFRVPQRILFFLFDCMPSATVAKKTTVDSDRYCGIIVEMELL